MKKIIACLVCLLLSPLLAAKTGLFFNVSGTSNLTSTGTLLSIETTVPKHTYAHAGIKINTPGYSLSYAGTECTPSSNGYCLFSVSNTAPHSIHVNGTVGTFNFTLCLDGAAALSCQQQYSGSVVYTGPKYAYIPNDNGFVSLCPINIDGSFGACVDGTDPSQSGTLGNLYQIVFNPSGTLGYLTTFGNVFLCPVNADKTLGICTSALDNVPGLFNYPYGIVLNTAGTRAYVVDQIQGLVYICSIGSNGTFSTCVNSGNTGAGFGTPLGISFNSTQTHAYVADYSFNAVTLCPVTNTGTFGVCTYQPAGGNGPGQVALNLTGTHAYVANSGDSAVAFCTVNADGSFNTCVDSGNTGVSFDTPFSVVLNAAETKAYVSNDGNSTVSICPLNANGTFGNCVDSGNSGLAFGGPEAITLVY